MTKLSPDAERDIRQLDEADDADDPEMKWAEGKPYLRRLSALLSLDPGEVAAFGKLPPAGAA